MKKLMLATALVASAAAFADPINAISFEGYTADAGVTVGNKGDTPDTQGGNNAAYFCFDGEQDGSTVKAYGGENLAAPAVIKRPAYFAQANNDKYLELSTEGGTLWRSINIADSSGSTYLLGDPTNVVSTGLYLDTLVQFTPTEDGGAPTLDAQDKLAIWLNVNEGVTNLMVQTGYYDDTGALTPDPTNLVLTGKAIVAGEWYRLTIKAVDNILPAAAEANDLKFPGFKVYIDSVEMSATSAPVDPVFVNALKQAEVLTQEEASDIINGKYLPSRLAGVSGTPSTLQGIGFKGSGALDDIVWTEEDPFAAVALDFTLTWPTGVTPTSYTINGGEPVALALGSTSPFQVPGVMSGDTVAFTFTNADGVTKTMSLEAAAGATDIDASTATYVWADYLGDAVNGAYTIDDADDLNMLRKGVAAGLATVGETFNQTANIDMASAGPFAGIGTYAANLNSGVSFNGTYDGQGFTISNIDFTQRNYGGVFNQVKGGTIKNLTVDTITCNTLDKNVNAAEWGCAIVGNAGLGATLQNLVAQGSFGNSATPCSHNVAGIAIRVCGGASNVVDGVTMLETLVKDCTNNATLYGFYTKAAGITALTQDQNGVPNDYVLYDGCVNNANIAMVEVANSATTTNSTLSKIGRDGLGGIVGYVADGTKIKDCVNNGTLTSALTTAKIGGIVGWAQGRTLDDLGGNKNPAAAKMVGDPAGSTITGFTYATVDNGVATTTLTLAKDGEYLLEGNAAPVFAFAEAGTIAFDTALGYTLDGTGITAAQGLTVTDATAGTVTTYTAAVDAPPSVEIEPGEQVSYDNEADATAALANVTIVTPDDVSTNETITAEAKTAYKALFEPKVVPTASGYAIEVGLTAAAETALQTQADGDAAEIVDAINESTVTFAATPGLYYSIEHGTSLSLGSETEKVMATGSTLTLDMPAKPAGATSGFYKVKISVTK